MINQDTCEICNTNLYFISNDEKPPIKKCTVCGKTESAYIFCPNGHYICSECHEKKGARFILEFCIQTTLTNPYEMLEEIYKHPSIKNYGPEHHVLLPLVFLTFLKNNPEILDKIRINVQGNDMKIEFINAVKIRELREAYKRALKIPGGWCGYYGSCGAAIGLGVAFSVLTKATPIKRHERTLANKATSRALSRIADDLQHCCKRSVRYALKTGIELLEELINERIIIKEIPCKISKRMKACEKTKCSFYEGG